MQDAFPPGPRPIVGMPRWSQRIHHNPPVAWLASSTCWHSPVKLWWLRAEAKSGGPSMPGELDAVSVGERKKVSVPFTRRDRRKTHQERPPKNGSSQTIGPLIADVLSAGIQTCRFERNQTVGR